MEYVSDATRRTQLQKRKESQNLQWRPITKNTKQSTTEGGTQSTKDWVLKNFYSTNTHRSSTDVHPVAVVENLSSSGSSHKRKNNQKIATTHNAENIFSPPICTDPSIDPSFQKILNSKNAEERKDHVKNAAKKVPANISSPTNCTNSSLRVPFLSYAQVLKKSGSNAPNPSPKGSVYRGEPAVYFEEFVINASAEKFKYCLVGKFPRSWPSLAQIRDWVGQRWKLKSDCFVTLLDRRHVLIRFDNIHDMLHVWVRNRWWIDGHLMKVFRWTPNFRPAKEDPCSAAVWIALPYLQLVFFQEDILFKIANVIGKPLSIDSSTRLLSRTNVARICVEVDLLHELPRRVWIGIGRKGFWQDIQYEKLPSYCSNCRQQGHATRICKFSATDVIASQDNSATCSTERSNGKRDGNSQEQCRISKRSVQNCVQGEGSLANDQLPPSIHEKDENNQHRVAVSDEQPFRRFSLVEALNERLAKTELVKPRKNKGEVAYGGTFTTVSIMNEVFRAMTDDGENAVHGRNKVDLVKTGKESVGLNEECSHTGNGILEEHKYNEFESNHSDQHEKMEGRTHDLTEAQNWISLPLMKKKSKKRHRKKKSLSRSDNSKKHGRPSTAQPSSFRSRENMLKVLFSRVRASAMHVQEFLQTNKLRKNETARVDNAPFFDLQKIVAATGNFSVLIGQGGFGSVYKGVLPEGDIAVKRLSKNSRQGVEEFKNEVILITKLRHKNLVRLLGCCAEEGEMMLVYEYMPNKSLDNLLFGTNQRKFLDWEKRFTIITGIAQGLLYLHEESRLRVIHRDMKSSNILLDLEMNAKISDFGLARILGSETQENTSRVVGTLGYMAPEYALSGHFSVKSDIFSFGVILLEIISGRKHNSSNQSDSLSLMEYAWRLWAENKGLDLLDASLREACNTSEVLNCIHAALLCVQDDPRERPTIISVLPMLVSGTATLPVPKQPAFLRSVCNTGFSSGSQTGSVNELTVSTIVGQ